MSSLTSMHSRALLVAVCGAMVLAGGCSRQATQQTPLGITRNAWRVRAPFGTAQVMGHFIFLP